MSEAADRSRPILRKIATVSLLVADYDEAIAWYREKLQFVICEDTDLGEGRRWVTMASGGPGGVQVLLAKAKNERELAQLGCQAGGRVFLFLETSDFWADYEAMRARGVAFNETPRREAYGTVAVFADLYGNLWDLLQPVS